MIGGYGMFRTVRLIAHCPHCGACTRALRTSVFDFKELQCRNCGYIGELDMKRIFPADPDADDDVWMSFGEVIEAMKADPSKRFARKGWNGKGQYIYLTQGRAIDTKDWNRPDDVTGDEEEFGFVKILPHIDMKASDGSRVIGWLASQTDMLSDDWYEVRYT